MFHVSLKNRTGNNEVLRFFFFNMYRPLLTAEIQNIQKCTAVDKVTRSKLFMFETKYENIFNVKTIPGFKKKVHYHQKQTTIANRFF